ncbi:MAG: calcium-binding protein [Limnospira sp.]
MTSGTGPTILTNGPDSYNQDAPFAPKPDTILGIGGNDTITTSTLGGSLVYGDSLIGSDISGNDLLTAQGEGDTIFAGPGNDSLQGRASGVALVGEDGRDTLSSDLSATLYGGAGRDFVIGVAARNYLFGNQDEDTILGGLQGGDSMYGGKGDDQLGFYNASGVSNIGIVVPPAVGGANQGNNFVSGNIGNDTIVGVNTGDSLYGGQDNDSIVAVGSLSYNSGDLGNDTLWAQNPSDRLSAFNTDTALVGLTQVTLIGGGGDDSIRGAIGQFGDGQNLLDGGEGNDTILSFAAQDSVVGGGGDDLLSTNTSSDLTTQGIFSSLEGFAGGSTLDGGFGNDTLVAAFSSDSLFGGEGNDSLFGFFSIMDGGPGNDTLDGSGFVRTSTVPLTVSLFGGTGADFIIGASATALSNVLDGGAGNDTIVFGSTSDTLLSASANMLGNDSISGGSFDVGFTILDTLGNNTVVGSDGNDFVRTGSGNDFLVGGTIADGFVGGGAGDDTLIAGGGNDFLFGGTGTDTLNGEAGDDTLQGGFDSDVLVGGDGQDRFLYQFKAAITGTATDLITDFNAEDNDLLVFSRDAAAGGFGFELVGGVPASELGPNQLVLVPTGFYGDGDANINTPLLAYEQATGTLKYDANGSGTGGVSTVARFVELEDGSFPRLNSSDFLII